VARCLIIACGCRGKALARELIDRGHAVRATTRDPERLGELEELGAEAVLADPDRVATLARAFEHVSAAYVLLGSASGSGEQLEALHSTRLDMLLSKMIDSTVRGIVYEAQGSVPEGVLAGGAHRVQAFCEDSRVPYALLRSAHTDFPRWLAEAVGALETVLSGRPQASARLA
jgi:NAD(P)-dependent dehydrogenase (short-subunit alcohol dehydrogenase family)